MLLNYRKLLIVVTMLACNSSFADAIHDPTKPKLKIGTESKNSVEDNSGIELNLMSLLPMTLQGVLDRRNVRIAIISDQLYAEGDKINGYIISKINKDNVVLVSSGKQKRLYIYE